MEYMHPYAPTPHHQRLPAVRAHMEGEALCDAGDTAAGVALLKRAISLAWELDSEEWPAWALSLYATLADGAPPPPPPPILSGEASGDSSSWVVQAAANLNKSERAAYWASDATLCEIVSALDTQHFVVLDGVVGLSSCQNFRGACEQAWQSGDSFSAAKVAAPGNGTNGARSALTRSDHLAWVNALGEGGAGLFSPLRDIVLSIDTIITALRSRLRDAPSAIRRQRPQVARYGDGDAFNRHCDNYCPVSRGGPHCNGRWLTCVLYTSEGWESDHGGCLRLYKPQGDARGPDEPDALATEDDAVVDVAPIADRLLVFYSDFRCPHAVLPVRGEGHERYAATLWYNRVEDQGVGAGA